MDKEFKSSPPPQIVREREGQSFVALLRELATKNSQTWDKHDIRSLRQAELGFLEYEFAAQRRIGCFYPGRPKFWHKESRKVFCETENVRKTIQSIGIDDDGVSFDHFFAALAVVMDMQRRDHGDYQCIFQLFDLDQAGLDEIPFDTVHSDICLVGTDLIGALISRSSDKSIPPGALGVSFSMQSTDSPLFTAHRLPFERLLETEGLSTWVWKFEFDFGADAGDKVLGVMIESVANHATDWPSVEKDARDQAVAIAKSKPTCSLKLRKHGFQVPGVAEPTYDEEAAAAAYKFFVYLAHEACTDKDTAHKLVQWTTLEYLDDLRSANALGSSNTDPIPPSPPVYQTPPGRSVSADKSTAASPLLEDVFETPKGDSKKNYKSPTVSSPGFRALRDRFPSLSPRWLGIKTSMARLLSPRSRSVGNSPSNTRDMHASRPVVPGGFSDIDERPPLGQGLGLHNVELRSPLLPSSSREHLHGTAELPTPKDLKAHNSYSPRTPAQNFPASEKGVFARLRGIFSQPQGKRKREASNEMGPSGMPVTQERPEKQPKVQN